MWHLLFLYVWSALCGVDLLYCRNGNVGCHDDGQLVYLVFIYMEHVMELACLIIVCYLYMSDADYRFMPCGDLYPPWFMIRIIS